jgi:hypothetical protein
MVFAGSLKPYTASKRTIGVGWSFALVIAVCAISVRAVESSGDPVAFMRVVLSAISIGVFFAVRRYSLMRGLLVALAIEFASGAALFVFVDYPILARVGPEIGRSAAMLLERGAPNAFHALAMLVRR